MKKLLFLLSFVFVLFSNLEAQHYKKAIGPRLGNPLALSFKAFVSEQSAFEITAGTRGYNSRYGNYNYRWYSVGAAYQIHKPIKTKVEELKNLQYYFGGGATAYFWTWNYDSQYSGESNASTSIGIQGYLGLEYTFDNIPLSISLDWVPTVFVNGFSSGFGAGYGGVALRYVLSN